MKGTIALVLCVVVAQSLANPVAPTRRYSAKDDDPTSVKFLLVERNGQLEVEDLVNAPIELYASANDVTFYFYSRSYPDGVKIPNYNDLSAISSTSLFSSKRTTVVINHGWSNDYTSKVNSLIRPALLKMYDVNVIVTDWSPVASKNYVTARNAVVDVGNFVGALISNLVNTKKISLDNVILIGHSLGAHIAGNAGAALGGKVARIIGLDPAGPLFTLGNTDNRIDPTDGKLVENIHTNGGLLGFGSSIGDIDYFPNGGNSQTGCGLDVTGSCSHSRAYEYFEESILYNDFLSAQCGSYKDYTAGKCSSNQQTLMGGYSNPKTPLGDYYLTTNSKAPFAQQ